MTVHNTGRAAGKTTAVINALQRDRADLLAALRDAIPSLQGMTRVRVVDLLRRLDREALTGTRDGA